MVYQSSNLCTESQICQKYIQHLHSCVHLLIITCLVQTGPFDPCFEVEKRRLRQPWMEQVVASVKGEMRRRLRQRATWRRCASAWRRTRAIAPSARPTSTPSDPHVLSAPPPPLPPVSVPPYTSKPETPEVLGMFLQEAAWNTYW